MVGLVEADQKAADMFGEDAFCAIDYADRHEVFLKDGEEFILLGRGGDWEEAFEEAERFWKRFYAQT